MDDYYDLTLELNNTSNISNYNSSVNNESGKENTTDINTIEENTNTTKNNTQETIIIDDHNTVTLETIHSDLGFICSFLVIASVIIFMRILYKLFDMFF